MRIEYENEDANKEMFQILDEGECFMKDRAVFMKTTSAFLKDFEVVNAVLIDDGTMCGFTDTELVLPISAKVVIE